MKKIVEETESYFFDEIEEALYKPSMAMLDGDTNIFVLKGKNICPQVVFMKFFRKKVGELISYDLYPDDDIVKFIN